MDQRELQLEVERLTDLMHDGELNEDQAALLNSLLDESEDARRYYLETVVWTVAATEIATAHWASIADSDGVDQQLAIEPTERNRRSSSWRLPSQLSRAAVAIAAAILMMIGIYVAVLPQRPIVALPDASSVRDRYIGDLYIPSNSGDALGETQIESREIVSGEIVTVTNRDRVLKLSSGVDVRLAKDSEAVVVSPWLVELRHGRSMVAVPKCAIGFRLETPETSVLDLGTEFAVTRDESTDKTVVHVMQGKVQTSGDAKSGPRNRLLRAGVTDVRSVAADHRDRPIGGHEVPANHFDYVKILRRLTLPVEKPKQKWHWKFAPEHRGEDEPAATLLSEKCQKPIRLRDAISQRNSYLFSRRDHQHCLRLDGVLSGEVEVDEIRNAHELRVSLDLRTLGIEAVPPLGSILAFSLPGAPASSDRRSGTDGESTDLGLEVEISLSRVLSNGPLGSVEVRLGQHVMTATRSVSDGHWHRLEVRFRRNPDLPGGWQIDVYLENRLEAIASQAGLTQSALHRHESPVGLIQVGGFSGEAHSRFIGEIDNLSIEIFNPK
jgi:hypothetical protein